MNNPLGIHMKYQALFLFCLCFVSLGKNELSFAAIVTDASSVNSLVGASLFAIWCVQHLNDWSQTVH